MLADRVETVCIVGGGTAGWMSAAALTKVMPLLRVELVESDEIGIIGVGEATIPPISFFNAMLELDEDAFVRATKATYKLGIEFVDWTRIGHRYFHPFGPFGADLGIDFQHLWLKARSEGDETPLEDYSIAAVAARSGRFQRAGEAPPNSPLSRLAYAFHFDAGLYAEFLRGIATGRGAKRTEGRIVSVERHGESGLVTAVLLSDGRRVSADFFIDCSGFRGLLIEEALGSGYDDWSQWLPCDRALAVPSARTGDPVPFTRSTARAAGWTWRIPLQHRTGNGYVYSSRHLSDDEAAATLLGGLDGEALAEPRQLRFTGGIRKRPWTGNVLSLGLAGGFLEPLESTSIHLVQAGLARFMGLFPTRRHDQADIDEYNRLTLADYEAIRDFLVLHYAATEREDTAFWRERKGMALPEELAHRLALFRASGRIFKRERDLFSEDSWLAVMHGQGVEARGYHPLAEETDSVQLRRTLGQVRSRIEQAVRAMPTHAQFLAGASRSGEPQRVTADSGWSG
jgi:tryptophan halogenase